MLFKLLSLAYIKLAHHLNFHNEMELGQNGSGYILVKDVIAYSQYQPIGQYR